MPVPEHLRELVGAKIVPVPGFEGAYVKRMDALRDCRAILDTIDAEAGEVADRFGFFEAIVRLCVCDEGGNRWYDDDEPLNAHVGFIIAAGNAAAELNHLSDANPSKGEPDGASSSG